MFPHAFESESDLEKEEKSEVIYPIHGGFLYENENNSEIGVKVLASCKVTG